MEVKSKLFATFLILISGCSQSSANDPEFFGANFSLSSCVQNAGNADALDDFMTNKMKIKAPLSPELSKYFLNGSNGRYGHLAHHMATMLSHTEMMAFEINRVRVFDFNNWSHVKNY